MIVKYHASACFDIDTEIEVEDDADSFEVWLSIIGDLESRYGLKISVQFEQTDELIQELRYHARHSKDGKMGDECTCQNHCWQMQQTG